MPKIDLKKELKPLYTASAQEATLVVAPPLKYLMLNGFGDPDLNPEFQAGIEALYTASYTLKFMLKQAQGLDYVVPPLEGLWWLLMADFDLDRRDDWRWTLMIPQPEQVSRKVLDLAVAAAQRKSPCRSWRGCAWRFMTKARPPRFSMWALTAMRPPPSTACTPLSVRRATISAASTTKSI